MTKRCFLLISLLSITRFIVFGESGSCGKKLTWTYTEATKTLTIKGTGDMYGYDPFDDREPLPAPWHNYTIKTVVIESGATHIGSYAFASCTAMTSVIIPGTVTSIGNSAFYGCSNLTSITIPSSVTTLGHSLFLFCSGLTTIIIESGNKVYDSRDNCNAVIETASNTLLYGCMGTVIPKSVVSIGQSAFSSHNLTSISIPEGVTSIGDYAFYACSKLTSITISSSVTTIGRSVFEDCSDLASVSISENVTSIGGFAFSGCKSLTSISIPSKVSSIGVWAFRGCDLNTITSEAVTPPNLGEGSVFKDPYFITLLVPAESVELYKEADGWKDIKRIFAIGSNDEFKCGDNVSWNLKDGILTIKGNGEMYDYDTWSNYVPWFRYLNSIESINIRAGVESIGNSAFTDCNALTSIFIPGTVTTICQSAVSYCEKLTSITIPFSVTFIEDGAFTSCEEMTSIVVEPSNQTYDSRDNCNAIIKTADNMLIHGIKTTVIPNSVTSIKQKAFGWCKGLTSITIPSSVTSIWSMAFAGCTNLQEVVVEAVTPPYIDSDAFDDYSNSFKYDIPLYVPVGAKGNYKAHEVWSKFTNVVEGKPKFTEAKVTYEKQANRTLSFIETDDASGSYEIPAIVMHENQEYNVTIIAAETFKDNTKLTSVLIPATITKIGSAAFAGCTGLKEIYSYAPTPVNFETSKVHTRAGKEVDVFAGVNMEVCVLYVPKGSAEKYRLAAGWSEFTHIVELLTGDANDNGKVDVADIVVIANHLKGNTPAGFNEKLADADHSGKVTTADLEAVARIIME